MTEPSSTRTEDNRSVIRDAFAAWQEGTGAITDVFAPDMTWRIEGHSLCIETVRQQQQFIDEVKVIDGTAFYDSISFNNLWTRVQPRT